MRNISVMPSPVFLPAGKKAIPQTLAGKAWSFLRAGDWRGLRQAWDRRWPLLKRVLTGPIGPAAMVLDLATDLGVGDTEDIRECVDPNAFSPTELALHLAPYRFALPFASDRDVLEVGCNWGYGSHVLAAEARRVIGIDVNAEAVACGNARFAQPNLELMVHDASQPFPFPSGSFDLVFSSEALEHIAHPAACVGEMRRVLRPGGILILKTPNLAYARRWHALNPYHLKVFLAEELRQLLQQNFAQVELQGFSEHYDFALRRQARAFDPFGIPFEARIPASFTLQVEAWVEPRLAPAREGTPPNLLAVCRQPKAAAGQPRGGN